MTICECCRKQLGDSVMPNTKYCSDCSLYTHNLRQQITALKIQINKIQDKYGIKSIKEIEIKFPFEKEQEKTELEKELEIKKQEELMKELIEEKTELEGRLKEIKIEGNFKHIKYAQNKGFGIVRRLDEINKLIEDEKAKTK